MQKSGRAPEGPGRSSAIMRVSASHHLVPAAALSFEPADSFTE
ncbi:hypothetical protein BJEO58_01716 [Brevibacterium jeotgali]|uniref:Uncharacterized protein n=1 Tax=Brevibacterium jeotgali TaxID=1262550 RepID=A0A2H1L5F6_9MICO|nr:hypothetical protein BJEO58_01716 [Brevibacterium jeotgali]